MDIGRIIGMKQAGMSNREISRKEKCDRGKISEVWSKYCEKQAELKKPGADKKKLQEEICEKPKYDTRNRKKRKYTEEVEKKLKEILEREARKTRKLGERHKQKLSNKQIHEEVKQAGYEVGYGTINNALSKLRKKVKEAYIRQQYELGERLEYDFAEVKLDCGNGVKTYHMAVFSSPASNFKWAYLYTNQKQAVFLDSHVKFFEMSGGVWTEVVYDNMKNVVKKFLGQNEKELNQEFVQMALYYGFIANTTNCFKPNEKGHVESSVQQVRNQIFATRYQFSSLEEA